MDSIDQTFQDYSGLPTYQTGNGSTPLHILNNNNNDQQTFVNTIQQQVQQPIYQQNNVQQQFFNTAIQPTLQVAHSSNNNAYNMAPNPVNGTISDNIQDAGFQN
ncbi:hypothetical protein GLOIN_2v1766550 [Rhizophagus clarus]|uniref:Uncharacterized protein n=1 Tax=Rhizophagus clarus TaxID=94130 RepID=A0A8H3LRQ5_9GLOM|nr:hypothetical protein GLOIN_2v1766550 [Rhizophagus clarus]